MRRQAGAGPGLGVPERGSGSAQAGRWERPSGGLAYGGL